MTWAIDQSAQTELKGQKLVPEDVLYQYDSPLLFTATVGLLSALCYKLEEFDNTELFLVTPSGTEMLSFLKSGKISVRGALTAPKYWLVEASRAGEIVRHWAVDASELPDDFLPPPRLGLHERFGTVVDSIEQVDAFFAVKFTGANLREGEISFRTFKTLVDSVYDVVNRVFTPEILYGRRRSGVFDFDIRPPKLASLLISIKDPVVDIGEVRRRTGSDNSDLQREISKNIEDNRDEFFLNAEHIISAADKGNLTKHFRTQNFSWLEVIADLAPEEGGRFDNVEIDAADQSGRKHLVITKAAGQRIREARKLAASEPKVLRGRIVEVNDISASFVMRDVGGRDTTCKLPREFYSAAQRRGDLKVGAKVRVRGSREQRTRRDLMSVREAPVFD